jgi:hypothetical protein
MVMGLCAIPLVAGINWKAVWLEKPGSKVFLEPGTTQTYLVMALHGGDGKADVTESPHLEMTPLDPNIVQIDRRPRSTCGEVCWKYGDSPLLRWGNKHRKGACTVPVIFFLKTGCRLS